MSISLIVVESAYLAKAISSVTQKTSELIGFRCLATLGRVKDVATDNAIDPHNIINERDLLHDHVARSLSMIHDADVYIATDSDIEGELIAHDVASLVNKESSNRVHRVFFNEISPNQIVHSISNPTEFNQGMVETCLARRGADVAIKQQYGGAGRVLSRALSGIQESSSRYNQDEMITEINLSGKNTLSVMTEMALQDIRPKEVSLSLQKLYSQGRVSYPRTLSGITPSRNALSGIEAHGEIHSIVSNKPGMHYDTHVDEKILRFLDTDPDQTHMGRLSSFPRDNRHLDALLQLYQMPFTRASTLGHHSHRLASLMSHEKGGLSRRGWSLLHQSQTLLPSLCSEKGSREFNGLLHLGGKEHRGRIQEALSSLLSPDQGEAGQKSKFHYPSIDNEPSAPSLGS